MCSYDIGGGPRLYVGGNLSAAGGVGVAGVASWDGTVWQNLGAGVRWNIQVGSVSALAGLGSQMIAGGWFDTADGQPARNVAAWDGTTWSPLGGGLANFVQALAVFNGELYAATSYSGPEEDAAAPGIWRWTGEAWEDIAPPGTLDTTSVLSATAMAEFDGRLVVAYRGNDELAHQRLASWDGDAWWEFPVPPDIDVRTLAVFNGELYCGGSRIEPSIAFNVRRWTGSAWVALPGWSFPIDDPAPVFALLSFDGRLWISGDFPWSASTRHDLWAWSGTQWFLWGSVGGSISTMIAHDGRLHIGGSLYGAGFEGIASWDDGWRALGAGTDGDVRAITTFQGDRVVGGRFRVLDGSTVRAVARWNGSSWTGLANGLNGYVNEFVEFRDELVAVGGFSFSAGGVSSPNIARWNGTSWSGCGRGIEGGSNRYGWRAAIFHGDLVVCGRFNSVDNGLNVRNLAIWNGTSWSGIQTVDQGTVLVDDLVRDVAVYEGDLIVGGWFNTPTRALARYDGQTWEAMNPSQHLGEVDAVEVHNDELYIAGTLTSGVSPLLGIAKWNGAAWEQVGDGIGPVPLVLNMVSTPQGLLVSGQNLRIGYSEGNEGEVRNILLWDGQNWVDLAGPVTGLVFGLFGDVGVLYAGGTFDEMGGARASRLAERRAPLDIDRNGSIGLGDFFAFLSDFFAGLPRADWDGVDGVAVEDVFAYLSDWFAGCL